MRFIRRPNISLPSIPQLSRRQRLIAGLLVVAVATLGAALYFTVFTGGGDGDEQARTKADVTADETSTVVPTPDCPTGEGDWELLDLHGDGGRVLNDGADVMQTIIDAARHDPLVLHTIYLDLLSASEAESQGTNEEIARAQLEGKVKSVLELRCVEERMQLHAELVGILKVSTTDTQTIGEVARELDLPVDENGEVRVLNTAVEGDEVETVTDSLSVDDTVLATTLPNGATVYHRTFCANHIKLQRPPPPGKGRLVVIKTDDGQNTFNLDLPVPGFRIIADGPDDREGTTDGTGLVRFDGIQPGSYQVREVSQPGWEPVTPDKVSVEVKVGQVVTVRFKNRQKEVMRPTPTPPGVVPSPTPPGVTPPPTATPPPPPTQPPVTLLGCPLFALHPDPGSPPFDRVGTATASRDVQWSVSGHLAVLAQDARHITVLANEGATVTFTATDEFGQTVSAACSVPVSVPGATPIPTNPPAPTLPPPPQPTEPPITTPVPPP